MEVHQLVEKSRPEHLTQALLERDIHEAEKYAKKYPQLKEFFDLKKESFEEQLAHLEGLSTNGDPSQQKLGNNMRIFCNAMRSKAEQLIAEILACLEGKPGADHKNLGSLMTQFENLKNEASDLGKCGFAMGSAAIHTPSKG